jgi:hypothetical protein
VCFHQMHKSFALDTNENCIKSLSFVSLTESCECFQIVIEVGLLPCTKCAVQFPKFFLGGGDSSGESISILSLGRSFKVGITQTNVSGVVQTLDDVLLCHSSQSIFGTMPLIWCARHYDHSNILQFN